MKDPDVVCAHIFTNTKFPVMEDVNWHELGRVSTKFGIVGILYGVSQSAKTAVR